MQSLFAGAYELMDQALYITTAVQLLLHSYEL